MSNELDDLFEQEEMFDVEEIEQAPLFDDEDAEVLSAFAEYNLSPEDRANTIQYWTLQLAQELYIHRRGMNPQQCVEQARSFFDSPSVDELIDD